MGTGITCALCKTMIFDTGPHICPTQPLFTQAQVEAIVKADRERVCDEVFRFAIFRTRFDRERFPEMIRCLPIRIEETNELFQK